jgi:hypothetical protein
MRKKYNKLYIEEKRAQEAFEKYKLQYSKKEDFYVDGIVVMSRKKGNISIGNC